MGTFTEFGLDPQILASLERIGYVEPTPIQQRTIPLVMDGHDMIGLAETGSGKTAACAIPVCHRVDPKRTDIQALILVPTRELALQYATEAQTIGKAKGVKTYALFGGEDYALQQAKLKAGVQVLIATPGRLIDLVYSRQIDLSEVATLILDEADEMLSMGFYDDMVFIIQCLIHEHQTLLFSATMPDAVKRLAREYMIEPREVVLTEKKAAPKNLKHLFAYCPQRRERVATLIRLIEEMKPRQSIIFCTSRRQVEEVCRELKKKIAKVDYIHGGLGQSVRTIITGKFRRAAVTHLVATDVAARGLDFSGVTHVFNYELTSDIDTYVHRSGRTGRSGREGTAISIVTDKELRTASQIGERIDKQVEWVGTPPPAKAGALAGKGNKEQGRGRQRSYTKKKPATD